MRLRYPDLASDVVVRCPAGHPRVVRCHPVRWPAGGRGDAGPEPFPTLFWLVCAHDVRRVSELERRGHIARLERRLRSDPELRQRLLADHAAYAAERRGRLTQDERDALAAAGRLAALDEVGIGGVRDRLAVKCLHMHYAHHLARGSALGALVAADLPPPPCSTVAREVA